MPAFRRRSLPTFSEGGLTATRRLGESGGNWLKLIDALGAVKETNKRKIDNHFQIYKQKRRKYTSSLYASHGSS